MTGRIAIAFLALLVDCGGTPAVDSKLAASVNSTRKSPALKDAEQRVPQAVAAGDEEVRNAERAQASGDSVTADLHLQRAESLYALAKVLARAHRSTLELAASENEKSAEQALVEAQRPERETLRAATLELEKKLAILSAEGRPEASASADPARTRARKLAAGIFLEEALLLCGGATLLGDADTTLRDRALSLRKVHAATETMTPSNYDECMQIRALCLAALTKQRRTASVAAESPDLLLSELTRAGQTQTSRDERGVVVTVALPTPPTATLERAIQTQLEYIGRVANQHPSFAIQLVVPAKALAQAAALRDALHLPANARVAQEASRNEAQLQIVFLGARE
jgi:hypothetical protein